jgi:hypothetical protein
VIRTAILSLVIAAVAVPSGGGAVGPDPSGCEKTYTRPHFHAAARSTFDRAFPLTREKATLNRVVRCQRKRSSVPIVREHRRRYRAAWVVRFWFERAWARVPVWLKSTLHAIAHCETGGTMDPTILSPGGRYRGLYQFSFGTWATVGGHGDPAAAPAVEQSVRAANLYQQRGPAPWPVCGR